MVGSCVSDPYPHPAEAKLFLGRREYRNRIYFLFELPFLNNKKVPIERFSFSSTNLYKSIVLSNKKLCEFRLFKASSYDVIFSSVGNLMLENLKI